jgi:hemolysin III
MLPCVQPMNQIAPAFAVPLRPKPLLRGVSHQVAAVAAVPLVGLLVARAGGLPARVGALVYGASLLALFASSAIYHRPTWPPRARTLLGRIDHAAIYVLIAGTYTPLCLLMGPGTGHALLALVWAVAVLGIAMAVAWDDAPKPLRAATYVAMGLIFVPITPAVLAAIGPASLAFLVVGAVLYAVGAVIYSVRRPDPLPAVFGFHEVFHLLVVAAAACHFVVVARVVSALG